MESSILSEVDDTSILRMVLSTCYWPALHSIGLSATPPAQRAGAQRLRALADIVAKRFLVLERRTIFSHLDSKSGILVHRTGRSDSIIAEFPWPGGSAGTFATISARPGSADRLPIGPLIEVELPCRRSEWLGR